MAQALLRGARPGRALALAAILTFGIILPVPAGRAAPKEGADAAAIADGVKLIDEGLKTGWADNKITPAPRCDDYEFIRRASLDVIGRIATPAEIKTFLDEPVKERRPKLIDRLLASEEYNKNWANIWANWLLTRSGAFGRGQYHEETQVWLEDQFSLNKPFHEIAKALIGAEGKNTENGAVNFILAHVGEVSPKGEERENGQFNMVPITSRISRLFLGIQTQCCQCHDHPFDAKLKQNHFWGINAFLHQVKREGTPPVPGNGRMMGFTALTLKDDTSVNEDAQVFFETRNAKLLPAKAQFIDGSKITAEDHDGKRVPLQGKARREELARLIVEHPNFGKAQVNRMWAHFFGKGFVNPIDDFNDQNPPSHPELLEELGKRYKHYGFNQKTLIRWICNSEAYNLSSVANKTNEKPESEQLFGRMLLKSNSPEELFESLMVATGTQSKEQKKELRTRWLDNLISNFGDDEGNEVSFNGTVVQALMMMNGDDLNKAIAPPGKEEGNVAKIAKEYRGNAKAVVRELYLLTLNRPPSAKELDRLSEAMKMRVREKDALAPYQDLLWALLNSNEFMLNH
jgi:hypothetical protein